LEVLRRAIGLHPRDEAVYVDLAAICMDHGAYDLGIEILDAGVTNVSNPAKLHAMRGIIYVQSGRLAQAEADFEKASLLAPEVAHGRLGLGILLMEAERLEESIRLLREQSRQNPNDTEIRFVLAQALLRKGREPEQPEYAEARAILENLVETKPDFAAARAVLGKIYLTGEETARGIGQLERALAIGPGNKTAAYQLLLAYRRTGNLKQAAALQKRMRNLIEQERREEVDRNRVRLVKAAPPARPLPTRP
jgi:tetratricopeptide (TPR) repeat protein